MLQCAPHSPLLDWGTPPPPAGGPPMEDSHLRSSSSIAEVKGSYLTQGQTSSPVEGLVAPYNDNSCKGLISGSFPLPQGRETLKLYFSSKAPHRIQDRLRPLLWLHHSSTFPFAQPFISHSSQEMFPKKESTAGRTWPITSEYNHSWVWVKCWLALF